MLAAVLLVAGAGCSRGSTSPAMGETGETWSPPVTLSISAHTRIETTLWTYQAHTEVKDGDDQAIEEGVGPLAIAGGAVAVGTVDDRFGPMALVHVGADGVIRADALTGVPLGLPVSVVAEPRLHRTPSGGYVIRAPNGGDPDWLIALDGDGALVWSAPLAAGENVLFADFEGSSGLVAGLLEESGLLTGGSAGFWRTVARDSGVLGPTQIAQVNDYGDSGIPYGRTRGAGADWLMYGDFKSVSYEAGYWLDLWSDEASGPTWLRSELPAVPSAQVSLGPEQTFVIAWVAEAGPEACWGGLVIGASCVLGLGTADLVTRLVALDVDDDGMWALGERDDQGATDMAPRTHWSWMARIDVTIDAR